MMLVSKTFSSDVRLNQCAIDHSAHVQLGCKGEFVTLIQRAIGALDGQDIARTELESKTYGKSTAQAVLNYKTKRNIINPAYQSKPDNIVGVMTIKALDREFATHEMFGKGRDALRMQGKID